MPSTTVSSEEFERDPGGVEAASRGGPVFITERGEPSFVLLSMADYRRLTGPKPSLAEALADTGGGDLEFEPPRLDFKLIPADLD